MTDKCYAAIDLGTNSCRLLIVDENGQTRHKESVQTRLGEGLYKDMNITPEAMDRGVECFYHFKQILDKYNIAGLRVIATAGCRMAQNREEFIRKVYAESLIKIEIINGYEEARLNLKGSLEHAKGRSRYVVLYDLGGGSTEITLATNEDNPQILQTVSVPWGARNAAEAFNLVNPDKEQADKLAAEIRNYAAKFVQDANLDDLRQQIYFLATSSTPLRLAAMVYNFDQYNRDKADGLIITRPQMDEKIKAICQTPQAELAKNPCIGDKRSYIFIAGCTIFKTIYDVLQIPQLTASLKSAVDGIAAELIAKDRNGKIN